ncbi:hypothetical protein SUGI_0537340 [Cryptomeria japonica]|nr:hypothetical protein SUGI_0537340 [Cryptomeria japonica]
MNTDIYSNQTGSASVSQILTPEKPSMASVQTEKEGAQVDLQAGDYVAWKYRRGEARGHVVEKLIKDKRIRSRTFKATEDKPKYLIKSDKSGKEVIRTDHSIRKIGEDEDNKGHEHHESGAESEDSSAHEDDLDKEKNSVHRLPHQEYPQPGQFTDMASI